MNEEYFSAIDKQSIVNSVKILHDQIEEIEKALENGKDISTILENMSAVFNSINNFHEKALRPDASAGLKALFTEMIHWDRNLYEVIEKASNWLENISREVFNLMEAGKLEEANILISDSRNALRQITCELKQTSSSCFFSTNNIHFGSILNKGSKVN